MTTLHSPAPWNYRVSDDDPDSWEVLAPFCESPIAEVPRWREETGVDCLEAEANVMLIAAAPRMYETLTYVAELLSSFKPEYLRQIGLDAALEESLDALSAADPNVGARS